MVKMKFFNIIFLIFILQAKNAESCSGKSFGPSSQDDIKQLENDLNGYSTIGSEQVYKINCCGVIRRWKFFPMASGKVIFEVWRPLGNQKYKLVGHNRYDVSDSHVGSTRLISLPMSLRISVEPGDVIGWHHPGSAIIPYASGAASGFIQKTISEPSVGATIDWSNPTDISGRTYAVEAIGDGNNPPGFKTSRLFANISDTTRVGSPILNLEVEDQDIGDTDLKISMTTDNPYFDVISAKRQLIVKAKPPTGSHSIFLRVEDHCEATGGATVFISVYTGVEVNTPPPSFEMNRLGGVPVDPHHLYIIGIVFAVAVLAAAIIVAALLRRKGILPIGNSKTKPAAMNNPSPKSTAADQEHPRKASHSKDKKERKTSVTKDRNERKSSIKTDSSRRLSEAKSPETKQEV